VLDVELDDVVSCLDRDAAVGKIAVIGGMPDHAVSVMCSMALSFLI
jgi:hypothetical protein